MSSKLGNIIDDLASMSIAGFSITALTGTSLKDSIELAELPARIISPIGITSNIVRAKTFGNNHVMSVEWSIVDITLLRAAGQGIGLTDIAVTLDDYLAAYLTAVRTLTSTEYALVNVQAKAQITNWPQSSERYYDSVYTVLTFSELNQ